MINDLTMHLFNPKKLDVHLLLNSHNGEYAKPKESKIRKQMN